MAVAKVRCQGCEDYVPRAQARKSGLGSVCSDACAQTVIARTRARGRERTLGRTDPTPSPRRRKRVNGSRKSQPTPIVRARVDKRDGGRCRWCGRPANVRHHIVYRSEGVDHSEHNLVVLCQRHHELVHSDKKRYQPVLRALIWLHYSGRRMTVPEVESYLARLGLVAAAASPRNAGSF